MPFLDMFGELNRFLIETSPALGCMSRWLLPGSMFVDAAWSLRSRPSAAMLARRGQTPLLLESRSMILGALPEAVDAATNLEVQLQPDDRIVLYTDGITEVFNSGEKCWASKASRNRAPNIVPASSRMKQGILDVWLPAGRPPTDDVSLMAGARSLIRIGFDDQGEMHEFRGATVLVGVGLLFTGW